MLLLDRHKVEKICNKCPLKCIQGIQKLLQTKYVRNLVLCEFYRMAIHNSLSSL